MGYNTNFDLEILNGDQEVRVPITAYDENDKPVTVYKKIYVCEDEMKELIQADLGGGYYFDDDCKWYDHEKDMKKFSKKFPEVVFVLIGEGEESGDLWKKYFKNGKMQTAYAQIVYDPFDEGKLA